MVKLEVVEDESFLDRPETSKNGALFQEEDDDDFTDTGKDQHLLHLPTHLTLPRPVDPALTKLPFQQTRKSQTSHRLKTSTKACTTDSRR